METGLGTTPTLPWIWSAQEEGKRFLDKKRAGRNIEDWCRRALPRILTGRCCAFSGGLICSVVLLDDARHRLRCAHGILKRAAVYSSEREIWTSGAGRVLTAGNCCSHRMYPND